MDINKTIAEEFKLRQEQIDNTVALLDDDKTIPFIARYRKELTLGFEIVWQRRK